MKNIFTYIGIGLLYTLSVLPMWVLHRLADFLYFLLYYVFGYRKSVVRKNLKASFPEKSEEELKAIEKGFYHHLCDLIAESLKGFTISEKEMRRRFTSEGNEVFEDFLNKKGHVILLTAHYNSWEWAGMSMGIYIDSNSYGMYKPLNNKPMEAALLKSRQKFGLKMFPMRETTAAFERHKNERMVMAFVADQTPASLQTAHWLPFLNQDTAFFPGPEKFARRYNCSIVYADITKVARSMYHTKFTLLVENPNDCPPEGITKAYAAKLEQILKERPQYWLWSHKRWKHSRPEGM
jgi:KDO2-lipid IV(A) lauroyltransferase